MIQNRKDPNTNNKLYACVYYIGLAFNVICGVVFGLPRYRIKWLLDVAQVAQLCILISCGFLVDAFHKMYRLKGSNKIIKRKHVVLLFVSFGLYGLIQIAVLISYSRTNL